MKPPTPLRIIQTKYVNPPIPIRCFDWIAYYDGEEEHGKRGTGYTEQEAIDDLRWQSEDE